MGPCRPAVIQTLDDDAIVERLVEVRGIGRWTVEMLLIFQLGRPDVLPVDDFGVRNGFRIAYSGGDADAQRAVTIWGTLETLSYRRSLVSLARSGASETRAADRAGRKDSCKASIKWPLRSSG